MTTADGISAATEAAQYELSRQQRLCIAESRLGERVELTVPLPGTADESAVRAAVAAVVAEHEALRTTIGTPSGLRVPVQTVHPDLQPAWIETADATAVRNVIDAEHGP